MINDIKLQSDDIKELMKARLEFIKELLKTPIVKDEKGYNSTFLSLEKLQEVTSKIMIPLGLMIDQTTVCENESEYLITTLTHISSGQFKNSVGWLFKEQNEMCGKIAEDLGGVLTYKQRYQWRLILGIGRGAEDAQSIKKNSKDNTAYNNTPYKQTSKPVQQTTVKTVSQPVRNPGTMSLVHQNELMKILKDDVEAIESLCDIMNVNKFSDIDDTSYEVVKKASEKLAKDWGI